MFNYVFSRRDFYIISFIKYLVNYVNKLMFRDWVGLVVWLRLFLIRSEEFLYILIFICV